MEGSKKAIAEKEDTSYAYLEKTKSEYAQYLMQKYFSGKNINGEEIFEETATIGGMAIKASRLSPTNSYADPVGFQNEGADVKKKSLADIMSAEESRRRPTSLYGESTQEQVGASGMQDKGNESSESIVEISADVWNEVQSDKKHAKSGGGLE